MLRVKGWTKFQHYKDRRPPWIKLSRELLENFDWYRLHNDSKALAVTIWLLAAENDDPRAGTIPDDPEWLGFRARMPAKTVIGCVKDLVKYGFLEHLKEDDSDLLAHCYQDAVPETETETENNNKGGAEKTGYGSNRGSKTDRAKEAVARGLQSIPTTAAHEE